MIGISSLPLVNALLNATATVLLVTGYVCIRRRRVAAHRAAMIAAFTTSVLFLISYVVYHSQAGSKPFPGTGPVRIVYFVILISHIILAAVIPFLATLTLWRGLTGRFDKHVPLARWTLPLWLYVSVTGIIVYVMLYRI